MKPFMNPYISDTGSGSSMDQSINKLDIDSATELKNLQLALGFIPNDYQYGGVKKYLYITHPKNHKKISIFSEKGYQIISYYYSKLNYSL